MSSMIEPRDGAHDTDRTRSGPGVTLTVASLATLLVLVDFTTVLTTAGDTSRALGASLSWQTWALSAMSLGLAAALLTAGALADDLGRRRVLAASGLAMAVATAAAAAAPSIAIFVGARALQGVAGAGMIAASLGLVGHAYPAGAARTRATGIWGAMVGAGIAAGPILGGALALVGGWRAPHWCEAALALVVGAAAAGVPESRAPARRPLDLPGAALLAAAMSALTAALTCGRQGWAAAAPVVLLGAGAGAAAAFVILERRRARPLLDLRLLRRPDFGVSLAGGLLTGLSLIGLLSYLPTFLQRVQDLTPLASAAVLACWSATSTVAAWHARRLPERLDVHHRLVAGFALAAAGLAALTGMSAASGWARLVPGLVVAGLGTGLVNAALGRIAVASVPAEQPGLGSGANNTARYLGGAAGIAMVVAIASRGDAGPQPGGWNHAAIVCSGLCLLAAAVTALLGRRSRRAGAAVAEAAAAHGAASQLTARSAPSQ